MASPKTLPLAPAQQRVSVSLHPPQPGWNRSGSFWPSREVGSRVQCTWGVCLCSPGAQGSALGAPACWVSFFLKAPLADLRGVNKSLPHLPGLQMRSHQSAGSQGGPGPLRLPRCPWGLRSSWGAASPPDSLGPRPSSRRPSSLRVERGPWLGLFFFSLGSLCSGEFPLLSSSLVTFFFLIPCSFCYEFHPRYF